jgi:hypothetical protein
MITRMFGYVVSLLAMLVLVASCGGGGSVVAEGGIGGTGISYGKISGFGSVISNGVTFNTDNASFTKDGTASSQNELRVGMVVSIQGEIDANGTTGTADSVTYFDLLEGPVEGAPGTNSFVAMGQTIIVDGLTQYEGIGLNDISDLFNGDVVEVSGFYRADGSILATYIESKVDTGIYEIKGEISNVILNTSFNIGSLQVNVADTTGLQNGDLVEAEGTINAGELNATSVNLLTKGLELEDADDAELEGVATTACGVTTPCSFHINFIKVNVTASTQFEGGLIGDIQPGVRLEVEGELINGEITAEEIEFEDGIELISEVVSKTATSLTLEYGTTDITVTVDEFTEIDGFASFNDIQPGDHIKVRARDDNTNRAVRIENAAGSVEIELLAPLQIENPGTEEITLLGVTITISGINLFDDRTDQDLPILNTATFFDLVEPGDLIKATGEINGGITWQEVEIE